MKAVFLPDIGQLGTGDWASILAPDPGDEYGWGSSYSGAFSTVDGSRVEDITAERIARVDLTYGVDNDGPDLAILTELTDGTWAACMAWADFTGWGCQDDVQWKVAPTRDEAISQGLDREARRKLGVPLPGEDN
jgi:hypothetical protein